MHEIRQVDRSEIWLNKSVLAASAAAAAKK